MLVALILVSLGFAITLFMLLFGQKGAAATSTASHRPQALEADTKARASQLEGELARRKKELEEQRAQANDLKAQLAQAKKKLFEAREADKGAHELARARAEVERSASAQLESTRAELAHALSELQRLRAEQEAGGRKPRAGVPAAPAAPQQIAAPTDALVVNAAVEVPAAPAAAPAEAPRRYRELNDADREKMERLEHTANKERARAAELEKELKKHRSRADTAQRVNNVMKGELDLVKDKFKALEKRLNRTLLERDLMRRAIKDLEKRTGTLAERTELTPDELAHSDRSVEERQAAEAAAAAPAPAAPEAPAAEEKSGSVG